MMRWARKLSAPTGNVCAARVRMPSAASPTSTVPGGSGNAEPSIGKKTPMMLTMMPWARKLSAPTGNPCAAQVQLPSAAKRGSGVPGSLKVAKHYNLFILSQYVVSLFRCVEFLTIVDDVAVSSSFKWDPPSFSYQRPKLFEKRVNW